MRNGTEQGPSHEVGVNAMYTRTWPCAALGPLLPAAAATDDAGRAWK